MSCIVATCYSVSMEKETADHTSRIGTQENFSTVERQGQVLRKAIASKVCHAGGVYCNRDEAAGLPCDGSHELDQLCDKIRTIDRKTKNRLK